MLQTTGGARVWLPAIGAGCLVVAASVYALSRTADVAEGIREMRRVASTLTDAARNAEHGTLSPEEVKAIEARHAELNARMRDSCKPGLVASQLSEAVRRAGLSVLRIQPVSSRKKTAAPAAYPNYRVVVQGGYRQIATYMQGCCRQRIPIRVVGFRIAPSDGSSGRRPGGLRAEITIEAFQKGGNNTAGDGNA